MRLRHSQGAHRVRRVGTSTPGKKDYTRRFAGRAVDYARYRPSYPQAVIERLEGEAGLEGTWKIADVGSGTGILSELFLRNGNAVFCVEPNEQMRSMAEKRLYRLPGFVSVAGRAEATTLPSRSVEMVVVGQALHWFDIPKAKAEFARILKEPNNVCIVFNRRRSKDPAGRAYSDLIKKYASDGATRIPGFDDSVAKFFGSSKPKRIVIPNSQTLSAAGLIGRLASASYMPQRGSSVWEHLERDARNLVSKYGGRVTISYDTEVYLPRDTKPRVTGLGSGRPTTRGRSAISSSGSPQSL